MQNIVNFSQKAFLKQTLQSLSDYVSCLSWFRCELLKAHPHLLVFIIGMTGKVSLKQINVNENTEKRKFRLISTLLVCTCVCACCSWLNS